MIVGPAPQQQGTIQLKMPETDIGSADKSNLANVMVDYSVDAISTDAAGDQKEFTWQMTKWSQYLGYYKTIPELKSAIDTKANWTMGAGFEAEEVTKLLLGNIRGNGKDSFNTILKNMIRTKIIGGDSFAEIIKDENDVLVNLKPLDPSSIVIVQNSKGMVKRYEQVSKVMGTDNKKFKPEDIFHLSRERIADEIHGMSIIPAVEWIILARNEAMADWKKVLHRTVFPITVFKLDTDDPDKIAEFKKKQDAARAEGENMYIPMGAVEIDSAAAATPPNSTMNPLQWIDRLNDYFYQAVNVPQIIMGNAKEFTDASGKIVYLSYEQSVKAEQLYEEEQILIQLNLEIKLTFPASLQTDAVSDTPSETDMVEEEPMEEAAQPADTTEKTESVK